MKMGDEFGFGPHAYVFVLGVDDHVPAGIANIKAVSIPPRRDELVRWCGRNLPDPTNPPRPIFHRPNRESMRSLPVLASYPEHDFENLRAIRVVVSSLPAWKCSQFLRVKVCQGYRTDVCTSR